MATFHTLAFSGLITLPPAASWSCLQGRLQYDLLPVGSLTALATASGPHFVAIHIAGCFARGLVQFVAFPEVYTSQFDISKENAVVLQTREHGVTVTKALALGVYESSKAASLASGGLRNRCYESDLSSLFQGRRSREGLTVMIRVWIVIRPGKPHTASEVRPWTFVSGRSRQSLKRQLGQSRYRSLTCQTSLICEKANQI